MLEWGGCGPERLALAHLTDFFVSSLGATGWVLFLKVFPWITKCSPERVDLCKWILLKLMESSAFLPFLLVIFWCRKHLPSLTRSWLLQKELYKRIFFTEKIWLVWLLFLVAVCSGTFHEKQCPAANILTVGEFYCQGLCALFVLFGKSRELHLDVFFILWNKVAYTWTQRRKNAVKSTNVPQVGKRN